MKAFRSTESNGCYSYMYFNSDRRVQQVCDGLVITSNRLQTLSEACSNADVGKKPPMKGELT